MRSCVCSPPPHVAFDQPDARERVPGLVEHPRIEAGPHNLVLATETSKLSARTAGNIEQRRSAFVVAPDGLIDNSGLCHVVLPGRPRPRRPTPPPSSAKGSMPAF